MRRGRVLILAGCAMECDAGERSVLMDTSNIYNYLIPSYTPKPLTKYDTHEASELKNIVKKIAELTKDSPKYYVKITDSKQSYMLGIKESAIMLQNGIKELCDDSPDSAFNNKKAYSSNPDKVSAELLDANGGKLPDSFSIKVDSLATTQINLGRDLYATGRGLAGGTYKFQVSVGDDIYDFQYNVKNGAANRDVMDGLSSFINKANVGIRAGVEDVDGGDGKVRMRIESDMTGSSAGEAIFAFADKSLINGSGIASYFELNRIERSPQSSTFYMDGAERHTLANEFTVSRRLKISLKDASDEDIDIQYFPDGDRIMGSLAMIADAYNFMIDSTEEYGKVVKYKLLLPNEMQSVITPYKSELEACGFVFGDGRMSFDPTLTAQSINNGEMRKIFDKNSPFIQQMMNKTEEIKINPVEYVDKTMSTYPNFEKPTEGYSYITSFYSGLVFNYYC